MLLIIGSIVMVLVVVGSWNTNVVRQVGRFGKAQLGKVGRLFGNADPVASYQLRIDEFSQAIKIGQENLSQYRGLIRDKQGRLERLNSEQGSLTHKIQLLMDNGRKEQAKPFAVKLASVEEKIVVLEDEIIKVGDSYNKFKDKLLRDQESVIALRNEAEELKLDLQQSESEAALAKFVPQNLDMGALEEDRAKIQSRINANKGKADVALEFSTENNVDQEIKQLEYDEKADNILTRFQSGPALTNQSEPRRIGVQ